MPLHEVQATVHMFSAGLRSGAAVYIVFAALCSFFASSAGADESYFRYFSLQFTRKRPERSPGTTC